MVLLGGTLQPFDYLASSLFLNTRTPPSEMKFFSCGHVVDRSNVATLVVDKGLNGSALEFTHKSKFKKELTEELLVTMARLAKVTSPFRSAERFNVEDIIDPRDTRPLLCEFAQLAWRRLERGG